MHELGVEAQEVGPKRLKERRLRGKSRNKLKDG